jgi:hypothetical protein
MTYADVKLAGLQTIHCIEELLPRTKHASKSLARMSVMVVLSCPNPGLKTATLYDPPTLRDKITESVQLVRGLLLPADHLICKVPCDHACLPALLLVCAISVLQAADACELLIEANAPHESSFRCSGSAEPCCSCSRAPAAAAVDPSKQLCRTSRRTAMAQP